MRTAKRRPLEMAPVNARYVDADGNTLPTPKARSMAALHRAATTCAKVRTPGDKDHQAKRALQYMLLRAGIETKFNDRFDVRDVQFDTAPDGSRRVRNVRIDSRGWIEVPHWDVVESVEDISDDLFA